MDGKGNKEQHKSIAERAAPQGKYEILAPLPAHVNSAAKPTPRLDPKNRALPVVCRITARACSATPHRFSCRDACTHWLLGGAAERTAGQGPENQKNRRTGQGWAKKHRQQKKRMEPPSQSNGLVSPHSSVAVGPAGVLRWQLQRPVNPSVGDTRCPARH